MINEISTEFTQPSRDSLGANNADDTFYNNDGTNVDLSDRSSDTRKFQKTHNNANENAVDVNINIYRYKFTLEFMSDLFVFSKIHQYDHRSDFKEAWEQWTEDNENIVSAEVKRLTDLGYEGDIIDKMYKSARYYFRKKDTCQKEPQPRRQYISVQKDFLDAMDKHIADNICLREYKPSDGFNDFCNGNTKLLKDEITRLIGINITDNTIIQDKIKKTYKNRYFMMISK